MAAQEALAAEVVGILRADQIPFILVGAAALAVRGLARGTHDIDFMCTERSVLDLRWSERIPGNSSVAVFRGDAGDPLVGTVRLSREDSRPVDVVVARWKWQRDVIERSETFDLESFGARVPDAADLVLLKLDAGSPLDLRDAEQLLDIHDEHLPATIDARVESAPDYLRHAWTSLRKRDL